MTIKRIRIVGLAVTKAVPVCPPCTGAQWYGLRHKGAGVMLYDHYSIFLQIKSIICIDLASDRHAPPRVFFRRTVDLLAGMCYDYGKGGDTMTDKEQKAAAKKICTGLERQGE